MYVCVCICVYFFALYKLNAQHVFVFLCVAICAVCESMCARISDIYIVYRTYNILNRKVSSGEMCTSYKYVYILYMMYILTAGE